MRQYVVFAIDENRGERDWIVVDAKTDYHAVKAARSELVSATRLGAVERSLVKEFELDIQVVPTDQGDDNGNER